MKLNKSLIGLVLTGATLLSSCSTWKPGEGYAAYKKQLKETINETLANAGIEDGYETLKMHSCDYLWVTGKGYKKPVVDEADPDLKEQKIQELINYYNSFINKVIFKVSYNYTYIDNSNTEVSSEIATDYTIYNCKTKELSYVEAIDPDAFYKDIENALAEVYIWGARGKYDYTKL